VTNRVFVYGTLKSGNSVRGLDQFAGAKLIGPATTKLANYDLCDLGGFPAVELNGAFKIRGEVWEVTATTLEDLDIIEGYPLFYNRELIETTAGKAWVYYMPDIDKYQPDYRRNIVENEDTLSWHQPK
jgi:gamma-glutamylcyclotransferase (GGCT)/AIG2-like uncharacterized protein YtfP